MSTMQTLALGVAHKLDNIKTCSPNLMPFHIDYSGQAPISTYLRINAAKETIGAPASPETVSNDVQFSPSTPEGAPPFESAAPVENLESNMEVDAAPLPPVALSSPASTSFVKRVTDATTRFISSFRGRTIQGLKVPVPQGYVGVVLRSDDASDSKTRHASGKKRDGAGKRVTEATGKRQTRGAKKVVCDEQLDDNDVSDSWFIEDGSGLMDVHQEGQEDQETRMLSIASQFSTFVLWHADHPVDEGRDEYLRSLVEWTQLAHLVSKLLF
ncbi:hypothetical protein H0H87_005392 [Tephrocybe sp. NHM501043]|nr:hypothetical protein H0H87_005392 [Tephrocybe sp. NHM501043]